MLVELKLEHDTWQLVKALYLDRLSREEDEEEVTLREVLHHLTSFDIMAIIVDTKN